ncbi:uncharacterized protein FPRO_12272 [Fusarium proliferatum ET1]|uniref:Uncharacterized protein n=1 Tax=Fusarium proliferatum (strain ET1) TaxID=1227346 RepID=A0A1L7W8A4_FUSPR|nr:uncharacterized protein FPRO_12272 [Fusarium proliferatum ET1]CZR48830.1 uncharacterized protein FPRO_12272 [Fusarium proliferatum ET1]
MARPVAHTKAQWQHIRIVGPRLHFPDAKVPDLIVGPNNSHQARQGSGLAMAVVSPQGSLDVEPLIVGQMSKTRWSLQFDAFVIPNPTDRTPVINLKAFSTSATVINNHQPQCADNKDVNDSTTTDDLRTINDATSKPAPTIQGPFTTERPTNTMDDDDGETQRRLIYVRLRC